MSFPSDPIAAVTHPDPYPPGEALAITIAQAGIEALLQAGIDLERLAENVTYRPSANTRIPLFRS